MREVLTAGVLAAGAPDSNAGASPAPQTRAQNNPITYSPATGGSVREVPAAGVLTAGEEGDSSE